MGRHSIVAIACLLALAGCDRAPPGGVYRNAGLADGVADLRAPPAAPITMAAEQQQFSYSHTWSLQMARAAVAPRFTRARDLCLHDTSLHCKLVSANLASGDDFTSASLDVQLPHGKLDAFERALLSPVAGEAGGDAKMISRATQAQSVETQAGDTARKVAQLTAYRDRLADIAKRPGLSVDDIIKLEAEVARVQGDLDEAANQHRDLTDGIARESVSIQLQERAAPPPGRWSRLAEDAGETLSDSAAGALLFVIGAIPWLPIIAIAIWLVSRLWRWLLQRRTLRVAIQRVSGTDPASSG